MHDVHDRTAGTEELEEQRPRTRMAERHRPVLMACGEDDEPDEVEDSAEKSMADGDIKDVYD